MCATLCCQRWIVSGNLNCQLWPKLSEVWTQETLFVAFYIDGSIFFPKNYVTPSLLSSLKLHRQQQYTSQTEFDYRSLLAPPIHQWSSRWSEHELPAWENRRELQCVSKWLTFTSSVATRYEIILWYNEGSIKKIITAFLNMTMPVSGSTTLVKAEISQGLWKGLPLNIVQGLQRMKPTESSDPQRFFWHYHEVDIFRLGWNVLTIRIVMTFRRDTHGAQWKNPNDLVDPLTCHFHISS